MSVTPQAHDIRRHGAVPDGRTDNTQAIQRAIDACAADGGGCVLVPPGVFASGHVHLRSRIRLHIEAGGVLQAIVDTRAYNCPSEDCLAATKARGFITGCGLHEVVIDGDGVIDAQGPKWWVRHPHQENKRLFGWVPPFDYTHPTTPDGQRFTLRSVLFRGCSNVQVRNVTLRNSEEWTLDCLGCTQLRVHGVRFRAPLHGPNTDGVDVQACEDVTISDCEFYTGDDAVCIANYSPQSHGRACRNIAVTNCLIVTPCNALKIYGARGLYENITMSNCVIRPGRPEEALAGTARGTIHPEHHGNALASLAGICIESGWRGIVRGVAVSNIVMEDARAPVFLRLSNHGCPKELIDVPDRREPGVMEDIVISNVVARGGSTTSTITGIPGHRIRGVSVSEARLEVTGGGGAELARNEPPEKEDWYPGSPMFGRLPAHGLYCRHVEDLTLRNVSIRRREPDARPAIVCDDAARLRFDDIRLERPDGREAIRLSNVCDAVIRMPGMDEAAESLMALTGDCRDVHLDTR